METIQVEIRNKNAMAILKGLEKANIIKLIKTKNTEYSSPSQFKGAITPERALEMIQYIEKSRDEWNERTI